jgi:hypothetical protein
MRGLQEYLLGWAGKMWVTDVNMTRAAANGTPICMRQCRSGNNNHHLSCEQNAVDESFKLDRSKMRVRSKRDPELNLFLQTQAAIKQTAEIHTMLSFFNLPCTLQHLE